MTTFEKNLNKANLTHKISHWWDNNGYKVMRVVLFPVWVVIWTKDKIENKWYSKAEWSEEQAKVFLDKFLPQVMENCDGALWFCEGWNTHFYNVSGVHGKNKTFARKYNVDLKNFVVKGYEIENYIKTIEDDNYDLWVKFEKKEG